MDTGMNNMRTKFDSEKTFMPLWDSKASFTLFSAWQIFFKATKYLTNIISKQNMINAWLRSSCLHNIIEKLDHTLYR